MPARNTIKRRTLIGNYNDSGNVVEFDLTSAQGMLLESSLSVACQPTLTAANNTKANTGRGDTFSVIEWIRLEVNNGDPIFDLDPADLAIINRYEFGNDPYRVPTLGDTVTPNPKCFETLLIAAADPKGATPLTYALLLQQFSSVKLRVKFRPTAYTSLNSAATGWTSAPVLKLELRLKEGMTGVKTEDFLIRRILQPQEVNLDKNKIEIDIPSDRMFTRHYINFMDSAGVEIASPFDTLRLRVDTTDQVETDMQSLLIGSGLRGAGFSQAASAVGNYRNNTKQSIFTWYPLRHSPDGFYTEALDLRGKPPSFAKLVLEDVNTPARINSGCKVRIFGVEQGTYG